jgi:RNA-directed DNA polymerase
MGRQESAEAVVAAARGEGLNTRRSSRVGSSEREGDAESAVEAPRRDVGTGGGTARVDAREGQARPAPPNLDERPPTLIEEVVRRDNMLAAYERVRSNGGAPGIDGMTVDDLGPHLREHWAQIRQEVLDGRYVPNAVRKVEIPKPDGKGVRTLGIPTVIDRLIQQAVLQVLQPRIDPTFSDGSFGFRPGRGTHDAVKRAREHIKAGGTWVVDLDLEKFFDRVNHDVLMGLVAKRVDDKRVLLLLRRFLQAGVLEGGLTSPRTEGTPQGGPISPFLSNVMLHELDAELERRGHRFVRYADDCNVYVASKAAGDRVMASLEQFLRDRLRLTVNRDKSAVDRPWERKFLGYTVTRHGTKLQVAPRSIDRIKAKLRPYFAQARGKSLRSSCEDPAPIIRGWVAYYRLAKVRADFEGLDKWVRHHLRAAVWRQWKVPRTRAKELAKRGVDRTAAFGLAYAGHGPWWCAGKWTMSQAIPARLLGELGLASFLEEHRRLSPV